MKPRTCLILVNHRAAHLLANAADSARRASAEAIWIVVVDNSDDERERQLIRSLAIDQVIDAPDNPGYGGGANLGARATAGDFMIVANPDIEFLPGSIDLLLEQLRAGRVGMAGPRFVWDAAGEWLLPPPDHPTRRGELGRLLAGWSSYWRRKWILRRRLRRIEFWERTMPSDVKVLSGAVLAMRREAFDQAGGFDPAFRLYFEEIDLMRRMRALGLRIRHVPAAVVRHLYNQSAGRSSTAAGLYSESERLYLAKWMGERFARLILERRRPLPAAETFEERGGSAAFGLPPDDWVAEASPLADHSTTAGRFFRGSELRIPPELWSSLPRNELFVRVGDRAGAPAALAVRLRKSE